jgi:hypothetical protein
MVPDSDTRVGGAEVDSDDEALCIFGHRNMRMQLARRENDGQRFHSEKEDEEQREWLVWSVNLIYIFKSY